MDRVINEVDGKKTGKNWNAAVVHDGQFVTLGNFETRELAEQKHEKTTVADIKRMANNQRRKFNAQSWTAYAKAKHKQLIENYK